MIRLIDIGRPGSRVAGVLTTTILVSVAGLLWFGYTAMREAQSSSVMLVQRWAEESADLLVRAIRRDMRGAQALVLANRDAGEYGTQTEVDFTDHVAVAFARYPYPESFFAWHDGRPDELVFFNRANREPHWVSDAPHPSRYPVLVVLNPPIAKQLLERIGPDSAARRTYSVFEVDLAGVRYQIVARLGYRDALHDHPSTIIGFTINLPWVRSEYFSQIVSQVARMREPGAVLDLAVVDEQGKRLDGREVAGGSTSREFPLLFFDPAVAIVQLPEDLPLRTWRVSVSTHNDPTILWAERGGGWIAFVIGAIALALTLSLILTTRAVRARAAVMEMRAEFVSAVTHELKTPLASIRAIAQTVARGRFASPQKLREYALMQVQQTKRLARLVDNLLAYSRVTDIAEVYTFGPVSAAEMFEDVVQGFRAQLAERGFSVEMKVPHELPLLRADRHALRLALDNLVDNAIRYSRDCRHVQLAAGFGGCQVWLEVEDRGVGIPKDEIEAVQRKFVRGARGSGEGMGLGLAIVKRIARDHGGELTIGSEVGRGTIVRIHLPVYEDDLHAKETCAADRGRRDTGEHPDRQLA